MRTDFTANFATATAALAQKPVTLIEIAFTSGTVYLSDYNVTVSGQAYAGKVTSWGDGVVPSDMASMFGPMGREWDIEVSNTGASPFSANFASNVAEETVVTAYHWFRGLTSADKAEIGRFYIGSYSYDETRCSLHLISPLERADKPLGLKINRTDFPDASYGTVGQALGYVFGSVPNVKLFPLAVGWQSALVNDVDATTIGNFYFRTDGAAGKVTDLPSSGTIIIGDEEITYSSRSYSAPSSETDVLNNYVVVTARSANARPYQQGTVAIEKLADGYVYGFPYHECKAAYNLKANGIPLSTGFTWNLNDTTTLAGSTLTTVNFSTHPRRIKAVNQHSHIDRRVIRRSGNTGHAAMDSGTPDFTSTANVPDGTKLGTPQNGYVEAIVRMSQYGFGATSVSDWSLTFSGPNITTKTIYGDVITPASTSFPGAIKVRIPLNTLDWDSDTFTLKIDVQAGTGRTGEFTVDSVEWHVEYTGGYAQTEERKDRIEVSAPIGYCDTNPTNATLTATPPILIATPQEIYIYLRLRVGTIGFGGSGTQAGYFTYTITGNHITTATIESKTYAGAAGSWASDPDEITIRLKVNSPDLTADCFQVVVAVATSNGNVLTTTSIDEATWIVEYPLNDAEVLPALEITSDGPIITADLDGIYPGTTYEIDDCDTVGNWATSDSALLPIAQETSIKQEGTGSIKATSYSPTIANQTAGTNAIDISKDVDNLSLAQKNIPLVDGRYVTTVTFWLRKQGTPTGNLTAYIYDSGDAPGTLLATSDSLDSATLTTSYVENTFTFNTTITGQTGSKVWLVLRGDWVDAANYVQAYNRTADVFGGTDSCFAQGSYWTAVQDDGTNSVNIMIDATNHHVGQRNIPCPSDTYITTVRVNMRKVNSPTGNLYCYIYKSGSTAPGDLIATSAAIDVSTLTTSFAAITFTVNSSVGTLADDKIWIVIKGDWVVDGTNYVRIYNRVANVFGGTDSCYGLATDADVWSLDEGKDLRFYITSSTEIFTLNTGADMRFTMTATGSENQTFSLTRAAIDLSVPNKIRFWARATVTGEILQFQYGEAALTENTHNITIAVADTWQREEVDISGIAAGSRDGLTKFGYKVIDASSDFTSYTDLIEGYDDALTEIPSDVLSHIGVNLCGLTRDDTSFLATRTTLLAGSYVWAGLIERYPLMSEVLIKLLPQTRCAVWHDRGSLYIKYLPDTATASQNIAKSEMLQLPRISTGAISEIINTINVLYNMNWRNNRWQAQLYKTDAASVTDYGTREIDLPLDFVTDDTMAASLRDYYIAEYKDRRRYVNLSVLYDNINIEQFDDLTVTHDATAIGLDSNTKLRIIGPPNYKPGNVEVDDQGNKRVNPGLINLTAQEA